MDVYPAVRATGQEFMTVARHATDQATTDDIDHHYVDAGGIRLHYGEIGSGPAVICLHGGGPGAESVSTFAPNVRALSQHFRLLLVDLPRFGGSEKVITDTPRLTLYSQALYDFMDSVGLDSASFVGNSMGGQAAMKLAIDHPHRVRALVAIGSTPVAGVGLSPLPAEGVRLLQRYYKGEGPSLAKMRQLVETLVYDQSLVTDEAVKLRYEASIDPDILSMYEEGLPQPQLEFLEGELGGIQAPTLLIWGAEDRAGPIEVGLRMLRLLPNAEMHVFNRCGHWAQVEHAEAFNEVVTSFLTRTGR